MNILLERGLPEEIDGVPIYADFRNMIRFEQILLDDALPEAEKARLGLGQLFDQLPPGGAERAVERLMWFYRCGREADEDEAPAPARAKTPDRAYDFDADAPLIYAGFYAAYGISLTTVDFLHWWEFVALLEGLPESTAMGQLMRWRTMDLSQIEDKKTRARYAALKRQCAVGRAPKAHNATAQEIARRNKERVAQRFALAEQTVHKEDAGKEKETV